MILLSASNIYKSYGSLPVLKGVDIEVKKGEIVSIVGPSGSGKSTLLHILGTLDQADQGNLTISGETISARSDAFPPARSWKRMVNLLTDVMFISAITWAVRFLFPNPGYEQDPILVSLAVGLPTAALYYFMLELIFGRTVGKMITRTKVFSEDGPYRAGAAKLVYRTIARFLPFTIIEGFSFLNERPKGWHDTVSDTYVTDANAPYLKKLDKVITKQALASFRNEKIGFIFQFHHLLPEFTALENVCIPAWIQGKRKSQVKARAEELLTILGLSERMHHKPNELSGGEQQRVAVARALINEPDIVFADDPTGNLDSANARELHQLFFDLRNKLQQTFLIVTHNEELAQLSDRIVHMKDGKVL
jgi:ABC-type lipoprotein export system ATPase subunit